MFQRILVAWDGSDVARRALDVGIDLARRYDAVLTAGSVGHSPSHAETEADRAESADAARRHLEGDHPAESDLPVLVVGERNGNRARIGARA
jgi:nucleotide-binding universal stress UspA family protein